MKKKNNVNAVTYRISICLAILFLLCLYILPVFRYSLIHVTPVFGPFGSIDFINLVLPILLLPFIAKNLEQKSNKLDRQLGDLAYTVYLFHWVPFTVYNHIFQQGGVSYYKSVGFVIYFIVVIAGSLLIYHFFEKKVEAKRKKLLAA